MPPVEPHSDNREKVHLRKSSRPHLAELSASTWWPALVTTLERGLQRAWTLDALIGEVPASDDGLVDTCQAWVWRLTLATSPIPADNESRSPLMTPRTI